MSTEPVPNLDSWSPDHLAAEWNSIGSTPPDPQPTEVPTPTPEGSTPPAEAAPAPVPEGSTPPAQPPASAVEDQDLAFALEKAGISKEDPQALTKLAKLFRETNNRAGEMGRELQALKKTPEAPVQAQPAPVAPPVVAPPVQAPPAEPQQTFEQYVESLVQQDREYLALAGDYQALTQVSTELAQFDPSGTRIVGGRIAEISNDIAQLQSWLKGPEVLTKLGLKGPDLDEFQRQEVEARLAVLEAQRASARLQYMEVQQRRSQAVQSYQSIQQRYREQVEGEIAERGAAEQEQREIAAEADKFKGEWKSTFEALATAKSVPEGMLKPLWARLVRSGRAHDGAIKDLRPWMEAEITSELETLDSYHRLRSAQHANGKRGDVEQFTQPANTAAVAPPAPGTTKNPANWEEELFGSARQVFGNRW